MPEEPEPPAAETPMTEEPTPVELPPDSVSNRVLSTAAQDLGLPQAELSILRVNQETWTDGCLGIGLPHEGCLLSLVEGWQLEVVHNDQSWFYRTDMTGQSVRQSYLANNLPPSVRDRVLERASADSGVPVGALEVTEAEPRTWDGCMGVEEPGTACTRIAIFGWRAVVPGENRLWVYHTDMTGNDIRLNPQEMGR
ncbi:MAG: hypothetical protein AAFQ89_00210 [Cyanobacteria bacterium J06626_18]